jgi:hypothetical protein
VEAWYDADQNITWLADWSLAPTGRRNWDDANAWAEGLNLWGYDDWRLPRMGSGDGCANDTLDVSWNCRGLGNELGYLWYVHLGNTATVTHYTGSFSNMAQTAYWTQTVSPRSPSERYVFSTFNGSQYLSNAGDTVPYATAVRSGDVQIRSTPNRVPAPGALTLLAAGLLGMAWVRRSR